MKTKDRIVEASLELFNQHGERAITTNHIAAHMGISPGNLYYHFRNKEAIIRAIFSQYERFLSEAYRPDQENHPFDFMRRYLDNLFLGLWRFRFLYASLPELLARDPELHERYLDAHHRVLAMARESLRDLVQQGIMDIDQEHLDRFAEGIKMVVTFWISHLYTQSHGKVITEQQVCQGVLQVLTFFNGYLTPQAKPEFARLEDHYRALANSQEHYEA